MQLVSRYSLPTVAQRGTDNTLSISVYDGDTDSVLVPTSGTLTLYDGSELVLDAVVIVPGPTSTYQWLAAATADRSLSEHLELVWTLVIAGVTYDVQQPGYLVRRKLYPVITDSDLRSYHTELDDLRDPAFPSFSRQRAEAWIIVQKHLLQKGRYPHLVLDPWSLRSIHIFECFRIIFRDAAQSVGDDRYSALVEEYTNLANLEWGRTDFRYDSDEDGYIDDDSRSAYPVIYLA